MLRSPRALSFAAVQRIPAYCRDAKRCKAMRPRACCPHPFVGVAHEFRWHGPYILCLDRGGRRRGTFGQLHMRNLGKYWTQTGSNCKDACNNVLRRLTPGCTWPLCHPPPVPLPCGAAFYRCPCRRPCCRRHSASFRCYAVSGWPCASAVQTPWLHSCPQGLGAPCRRRGSGTRWSDLLSQDRGFQQLSSHPPAANGTLMGHTHSRAHLRAKACATWPRCRRRTWKMSLTDNA